MNKIYLNLRVSVFVLLLLVEYNLCGALSIGNIREALLYNPNEINIYLILVVILLVIFMGIILKSIIKTCIKDIIKNEDDKINKFSIRALLKAFLFLITCAILYDAAFMAGLMFSAYHGNMELELSLLLLIIFFSCIYFIGIIFKQVIYDICRSCLGEK